ncbi:Gryzun, putative trafficking through golgi-domain-containing protein [Elsinoe ampelina]|uniref:Gryzun, putative trafficking through golgi-domain-containing protein n=1 Tax=Elsinoe ampelina TaxID=302913 RepID=A0A6A6GB16_9PEZI|nr:Gryzun, putative trafficking through golgi-domain-containing protein [Elsinoe ampelina]
MEGYPPEYVDHNLPLLAISGLGLGADEVARETPSRQQQSPGTTVTIEQPELPRDIGQNLRSAFQDADGSSLPWNGDGHQARSSLIGFKFGFIDRTFVYPRRKAAPAPQGTPDDLSTTTSNTAPGSHDLHSTLSPLSPTSPLFPDGLMTTSWMTKHQAEVPSVLLCFFELNADTSASSLQDNQLKTEINSLKTTLSKSSFRTRLAVALVTDEFIDKVSDFEERLSVIRRATGLDPKSSFFVLSKPQSKVEITEFVLNTLTALQPVCIDYYRDLTKHARRKKNRGYVPPPTGGISRGTSQSLSSHGWNARYDFKQGIFAEFRQEMDAAERHYASAIDELFNAEGVLETTPIWSARWEEARCLADITALRLIRCQLWRSLTSSAAETWSTYRDRTRALVDRRGKGTETYGYAAWEARWAEIMAQLITRAEIPAFNAASGQGTEDADEDDVFVPITIMAPPEKVYTAERIPPSRFLHHAGYYYRMARKWALQRYERARAVPDEDRIPPNETPASQLADRTRTYDTYMVAPPHEELPAQQTFNEKIAMMVQALDSAAIHEFESRKQYRMRAHVCLEQGRFLAQEEKHDDALDVLIPVWNEMSWRREGWWDLAAVVLGDLYRLAVKAGRSRLSAELRWEMASDVFGNTFNQQQDSFDADDSVGTPIILDSHARIAPVSATFAFAFDEGHVGDNVPCQLLLSSRTTSKDGSLGIKAIEISLNNGTSHIHLSHSQSGSDDPAQTLTVKDEGSSASAKLQLSAEADLTLLRSQSRVYNFSIQLKDVGDLLVTGLTLITDFGPYEIQYSQTSPTNFHSFRWWLVGGKGLLPRSIDRDESFAVNVLPKPPRVQLALDENHPQYFTGETPSLGLILTNEENDSIQGTLRFDVPQDILEAIELQWEDEQDDSDELSLYQTVDAIDSGAKRAFRLSFKAPTEPVNLPISVAIDYSINDDPTPVTKTTTFNFKFTTPFIANYDLHPLLDDQKWPSFFSLPTTPTPFSSSISIRQKWSLATRLTSHSSSPIQITNLSLSLLQTSESITCDIPTNLSVNHTLAPSSISSFNLPLYTRRHHDDRRPSPLALALHIQWRRTPTSPPTNTTLPIPSLTIPPAEPRVLCTARPAFPSSPSPEVVYTIENPSMHFLTFSVAMEASDQFAFSGGKVKGVSLAPLSRVEVGYRVLLLNMGKWVYPTLRVTDSYFNKTLRVVDAGEGVRGDDRPVAEGGGRGIGVWVPVTE